jgi:hypothetical protein
MEALADECDRHRVGTHTVAGDTAGGVGGAGPTGTLELRGASSRAPLVVPERE